MNEKMYLISLAEYIGALFKTTFRFLKQIESI